MREELGGAGVETLLWAGSSMEKCARIAALLRPRLVVFPAYSGPEYVRYANTVLAASMDEGAVAVAMERNRPLELESVFPL
jgi:hypothetical protein